MPGDFASNHHKAARKIDFFGGNFFQLQFHLGLGQIVSFERTPPETEWTLSKGERWKFTVEETTDYYYLKDPGLERVYIFKKFPLGTIVEPAFCLQVIDRNGNTLTYTLPADPTAEGPTSVTDGLGRTLTFTYGLVPDFKEDVRSYLTRVEDHTGRAITFDYEEVAGRVRLKSLTDTAGGIYQFTYDANHFMTGKTMPEMNTPYVQFNESLEDLFGEGAVGAVVTQTDAFGHVFSYESGSGISVLGDKQVILTNPDGSQTKHFHSEGNVRTAIVDELGEKTLFQNDDANDRI